MPALARKSLRSLPGADDIHRQELPNGITVLSRPNFNSPSLAITGFFRAGSLVETDDKLGLADFAISSLMRGAGELSFDEIFNRLESAGASFGYDSGVLSTSFGGRCLVEDLPLVLDLFSETLRHPRFPTEEVEKLRNHLLTGLAIRAQDTSDMADLYFDQMLFAGHPYGRPADGWTETIQAITRQDLVDFHERYVGPRGMVIVVVGGMGPERVVEAVQRALGDWQVEDQRPMPPLPPAPVLMESLHRQHEIAGKSQSDLVIGSFGPRRTDPEFFAASLGNSALGQFGMMGRIGSRVREKAGLAYYAYSSLSSGIGPGTWSVSAGVNPGNLDRAMGLILKELRRFVDKGVTLVELADSKANFIGRLPLSLESNGGVAGALLNIQRFGLDLDYYRGYPARIQRITREEVLEAARKFIDPGRLVFSVAGPPPI